MEWFNIFMGFITTLVTIFALVVVIACCDVALDLAEEGKRRAARNAIGVALFMAVPSIASIVWLIYMWSVL
jgi:hypothetical protein